MNTMLLYIVLGLVVVIAAILVVAALQSAEFRTERSAVIDAPAAAIFPHVNDVHAFQEWSPWAKLDPNCRMTFEGPPAGLGAVFKWEGRGQVGAGTMTVTESRPNELVQMKLDFRKPFVGTNIAEFKFTPEAGKTVVSWSVQGEKNFVCKAMGLFMDMDKMCGSQFERGLASLKQIVETEVRKEPALVS